MPTDQLIRFLQNPMARTVVSEPLSGTSTLVPVNLPTSDSRAAMLSWAYSSIPSQHDLLARHPTRIKMSPAIMSEDAQDYRIDASRPLP